MKREIYLNQIDFDKVVCNGGFPKKTEEVFLNFIQKEAYMQKKYMSYVRMYGKKLALVFVIRGLAKSIDFDWRGFDIPDEIPLNGEGILTQNPKEISFEIPTELINFSKYFRFLDSKRPICREGSVRASKAMVIELTREKAKCYITDTYILFRKSVCFENQEILENDKLYIEISYQNMKRIAEIGEIKRASFIDSSLIIVDEQGGTHSFFAGLTRTSLRFEEICRESEECFDDFSINVQTHKASKLAREKGFSIREEENNISLLLDSVELLYLSGEKNLLQDMEVKNTISELKMSKSEKTLTFKIGEEEVVLFIKKDD